MMFGCALMIPFLVATLPLAAQALPAPASTPLSAQQELARDIFKELIEI